MIVEGPWLFSILAGTLPAVGFIGRLLGDDDADGETTDADDESVDDILNDSFEEQADFGGLEDDDGDMFEESGDQATEEMETRIDEMEGELGELSSTVSTVRSENEEIAEAVGTIEDDVRKLLEIYEMVTRGINPFIDGDVGFPEGESNASFDVFDEEQEADAEPEDDLDEGLLDADADEFFDEDAIDAEPEEDAMQENDADDGKSFEELKEEFDDDAGDPEPTPEPEPDVTADDRTRSQPSAPGGMHKPYLTALPDHPVAEIAIMEWLEFLVEATGGASPRAAVEYYGRIDWIASDVVDDMEAYLDGFVPDEEDEGSLGMGRAEHVQSLQYLLAIDGASTRRFVGTTLDGLLAEGVLGDARPAQSGQNASVADFVGEPGIHADDDTTVTPAEETTLPDGGLALPLDQRSSSGVDRDGD